MVDDKGKSNVPMPVEPQPAGKAPVEKKLSAAKPTKGLFFTFLAVFLFLFVLFIVFLVVMLLQGGDQNPILSALGVEPALLQQLLKTLVSMVFGFLSLISIIVMMIGIFRRFTATKAEVDRRKHSLIMAIVSFVFLIFCVFLWVILYFYISRLQIGSTARAVILTDPPDTINLSAPIDITFDAREIEAKFIREGIVSYSWDLDSDGAFDDGNGRAIQHTYKTRGNAEGVYTVAVKVILGTGQEVITERLLTIANVRPSVHIEYEPQLLEVPLVVRFDASKSRDLDGSIISYDWDFDEDGIADEQGERVDWKFNDAKVITVVLTVTDNNGESVEEELIMDFGLGRDKEASIIVRPGLQGEVPFEISLDGSNSFIGERIQSYEWDFGDNSAPGVGRTIKHKYDTAGEYTLVLTVSGPSAKRFETEETVVVTRSQNAPIPDIQIEGMEIRNGRVSGQAPLVLDFDASGSTDNDGVIIEYQWDFDGDGVQDAVGAEVSYTFIEDKTFEVTLTVIDDDELSSSRTLDVVVNVPELMVVLDVSEFTGPIPLEVTFDASASRASEGSIISYTWDFGDASPAVIGSAQQTHIYSQVGEYTVMVTVLTDGGKRATEDIIIVAREIELQADFTLYPQEISVGAKVFFDASSSQGQINRYYWEFGDGVISRVIKPDHTYEAPGTYTVKLEIYDRKNRISRKEVELEVK